MRRIAGQGDEKRVRECKQCGRTLNDLYKDDICPACMEMNLFSEVKEYIRSNDVRETDVAEHFNIPVSKVRGWIKEGRIQYKTKSGQTVSGMYCQVCGKAIEFGTLCPECRKMQKLQVVTKQYGETKADEMYFLGKGEKK